MEDLLQGLKAAAEPTRLRLLALCARSELTVTELTQILAQSQPRVSRHLKLLCEAGLLNRLSEGTWAYYRLRDSGEGSDLPRLLMDLLPSGDPVLMRDQERLNAIKDQRARDAADYFQAQAGRWNEIRSLYVSTEEVEQSLLGLIGEAPIDGHLDIGTGTGRILELVAPHSNRSVGIDLSQDMLKVARANLEAENLRHCQVRLADMYNLPMDPGGYDLTTIHLALHFAERPQQVIAEAARMLRPGGRLMVVDFEAHDLEELRGNYRHRWLGFAEADVSSWAVAAGLEPMETSVLAGDPLTVLIWQARRPNLAAATPASDNQAQLETTPWS